MHERVVNSRRIYDGRVVNLRVDQVEMADGRAAQREVVEHTQAVAIVPVAADGRIVLVRQYRLPVGAVLLEVPAGSLDEGEDAEAGAQRELQEETGFAAARLTRLCGFWVAPGYCTEYIHVYLAEDLRESRLDHDEDEEVEVELLTLDDALAAVDRGQIEDAKSICGLLAYARCRGVGAGT
jgi:ADP-ribose pyrophosphatase